MIIIVVARHCNIVSSLPMSCLLSCQVGVSQGPKPGREIEGLKCLVNVLFNSCRPLSGIVIVLSDPIVIRITKTFRKT